MAQAEEKSGWMMEAGIPIVSAEEVRRAQLTVAGIAIELNDTEHLKQALQMLGLHEGKDHEEEHL